MSASRNRGTTRDSMLSTHPPSWGRPRLACTTPSEVGIATGVGCYWGRNCPHRPQDLMLLGSSEVGMNKAGTTAKTSRNNVLILTEAPCLCASSTLAKFQVFAVASFCCGTHMGVGILGSEYWGLNTGVGVTGVGLLLGSAPGVGRGFAYWPRPRPVGGV